jgi:hypothetical protein
MNIFESELLRVQIDLGSDCYDEKVVLSKTHFTKMAEDLLYGRIVSINGKQMQSIIYPSFNKTLFDLILVGGVKMVRVDNSEISFNNYECMNNHNDNICDESLAALKMLNTYYPDYYVDCLSKKCIYDNVKGGFIIKEKDRKIAILSRNSHIVGVKYLYETSNNIPSIIEDEYLWNDFLQRTGHFIIAGIYNYPEGLCLSYEMLLDQYNNY